MRLIDNKTIYYKDLEKESAKIANYLRDLGVKIGDRVSVQVQKSPEALYLYLACLRAGFVYHPLNVGYKEHELDFFLVNYRNTDEPQQRKKLLHSYLYSLPEHISAY